ncbi:MAG: ABC transporter permease, partial [Ignavibacteria bacterium]|nr:ABC transporter permease [Ignavibacteria bacterium]NNL22463.1 ABC transporter permease subunit [Ignavibacteriaceae bacterium]
VVLYTALSLLIYSSLKENILKATDFYDIMPEYFQVAFNFNINQWDNVLGFYVTYFVYFVPIITGCYSIILGTRLLSKEEQNKTAEFLLSRPISRNQIISSKLFTFFVHILVINLLAFFTGLLGSGIVSDWDLNIKSLIILHTYGCMICLFFGLLGFFITVIMKRAKAITGIGIGIVLGTYFFDVMIRVFGEVQFLLYLTPFKYINLNAHSPDYGFDAWRLICFFCISGLLILLSYVFYRRKDILV